MDRRGLVWVGIGAVGLGLGIAAAVWNAVQFAVIAGALALVAGVAGARLVVALRAARSTIEELSGEVDHLRGDLDHEASKREDLEQQLSSRIQLTSVRRGTQYDALTDPVTGLFSEGYFTVALEARIASARRNLKPVAVVVMEVIEGLRDGAPHPADATVVAHSIGQTIRESDTACRLMDGGYALVLEDTSETGAIWTVERIRRELSAQAPDLTMWAGVACYPAHGFSTEDVLDRADVALDMAREWRQDRIEVATAE
ncbi:MAG: GGDEF domain-containing protein [Acidimicrobiales bacterium]|nr:GGDEF domain-containing protein [Acidimicrobiales bacterium]MCB1250879.1 GGDEF domain-containing protein [Acidimicrobiales bacterium]MCB1261517.1 GGDEF domain-containing protein [Acidimicrobiales bacterium]